jgi:hypothetical protein
MDSDIIEWVRIRIIKLQFIVVVIITIMEYKWFYPKSHRENSKDYDTNYNAKNSGP